jgi:hypothetical protein
MRRLSKHSGSVVEANAIAGVRRRHAFDLFGDRIELAAD